ncbi:hypothetical protein QFZ51_003795 [Chitinophaga sp. W3I9]
MKIKQILLAARPKGLPVAGNFEIVDAILPETPGR